MAAVVVSPTAVEDLRRLIRTHSLPGSTTGRVQASLRGLERFPLIGGQLAGRWSRYRFILGPWRWMVILHVYDEVTDRVAIVTIQDARSSRAATPLR